MTRDTFWHRVKKPIIVGAPMDDVTDVAFRTVIARRGKPDVTFTEFTSADGLVLAPENRQKFLRAKLAFSEIERPIVAQLFSAVPERMHGAAKIVAGLGFDGIDINTGCPDKTIEKQGAGCSLIKNPERFQALYRAAVAGVVESGKPIPVSVKCRIGYSKDEIDTWVKLILEEKPAALTVHLRTREEMSKVPAHWEYMPRIVALRNAISPETVLIGNGDIQTVTDAQKIALETGCDGVMIGRGMFGNPWYGSGHIPSPKERCEALIEHITEFEKQLGDIKNYVVMKKHFGSYITEWHDAKELRTSLMQTNTTQEAIQLLENAILAL
jgi:nifR3 family TIM-barrel protein